MANRRLLEQHSRKNRHAPVFGNVPGVAVQKRETTMPPKIDVFVLGEAAGPICEYSEPKWPIALTVIPIGVSTLPRLARSPWADRIFEGKSPFAAIVPANDRDSLRDAFCMAFTLGHDPKERVAVHLMFERIDASLPLDPTSSALQGLRGFRALLAPRAVHGSVVFRRSKYKQIGPLRPTAEPVWDWAIRAARAGGQFNSTPLP